MPKGSNEADPRLNSGLCYFEAWAPSIKSRRVELLTAPYSWTICSSIGVIVFLCGAQRKAGYVDSRGSAVALGTFNYQELRNSVLNITWQSQGGKNPTGIKSEQYQKKTPTWERGLMQTGMLSLGNAEDTCPPPLSGYWGALSPPQLFALHLCDSMELLLLSLFSNVKLFFLLLLQDLPKVPFWQMEILVHVITCGQGKGVCFKVYILLFITKILTSASYSYLDNVFFMCCTISQIKLNLILNSQLGHPTKIATSLMLEVTRISKALESGCFLLSLMKAML